MTGVAAHIRVGNIGTVVQHGAPSDSSYRLEVQTPLGSRSDARLSDGTVTLRVEGTADIGRPGEPAAFETLLLVLRGQGLDPTLGKGRDAHGEDAILSVCSQTYTAQAVTVPSSSQFWRDAATGSATTAVSTASAAGWVRSAVEAKAQNTPMGER